MSGCVLPFLKGDDDEKGVKDLERRRCWWMMMGFGEVSLVGWMSGFGGGMRMKFDVAIAMVDGLLEV